jgi:hypothetical protein
MDVTDRLLEHDRWLSFTFGGVIAHVITYSAYPRQVEWERLQQAERSRSAEVLRGTAS